MKRSILFWPVVVGVPRPGNTSWTYPSPACRLLTQGQSSALAQFLVSLTNRLWQALPYCRPLKSDPTWERLGAPVGVEVDFIQEGRSLVCVGPQVDASRYPFDIPLWALSPREVLAYVIVLPGAHFALAAFIVVGLITLVVRALTRLMPESALASGEHP